MLIYKDNGSVCLSDPENTSEEEWKIITGAATLTGYDITDLATARKEKTTSTALIPTLRHKYASSRINRNAELQITKWPVGLQKGRRRTSGSQMTCHLRDTST